MAISLLTNVDSLNALQNLQINGNFQTQTIEQMSSGYRINTSGDDPAGLAEANLYRFNTGEMNRGVQNATDAIGALQIIDGGISNISQSLDRLQTLSTESASSSFTGDRNTLNQEFQTLLGEINRQAQSIGLNVGGQYAANLPVFVGGSSADNVVNVDLSASTVDTQSLGLGIDGATGLMAMGSADISSKSATSVANILADAGNTTASPGYTDFVFTGPGFSAGSQMVVAANLQGVTDINSLVAAINAAVQVAANGSSAAAAAFKAANIVASVHTDANGGQELAFQSGTTAFQVEAGDQMANALLGNLTGPTGNPLTTSVTGGSPSAGATTGPVVVEISGGSLASPVDLLLNAGASTASVVTAVSQNAALQAAGISASVSGSQLTFTDRRGEGFTVQATGDTANALGLGTFVASGAGIEYNTVSGTYHQAAVSGIAALEFSFNGAPSVTIPPIDLGTGGNAPTLSQIVNTLNTDFTTTPGLIPAGLVASASGNTLTISSNNNTYFRINPGGSAAAADLGFGVAGVPFTTKLSAASANDLPITSEGASGTAPLSFTPMPFGGDTQTISISANDSSGAEQTAVITLRNDNLGRQGSNIDQAIAYINSQLQGNGSLSGIVAVKQDIGGVEQIGFISNLPDFTVNIGASPNGDGMNGGQVTTKQSSPIGGSAFLAIDTQTGAVQAVAAVSAAVVQLGKAQAAVGQGENRLNYALNLAQSQIVNFSAAESGIRDANVAAEAANLSKAQILQQATIAALSQANVAPQAVLALLKGQ
ncbi:MAG: hypothetical protein JO099_07530 [Acidobacteriia bacterium]|nr:hypothetical protein [Terriglobia bacterium]